MQISADPVVYYNYKCLIILNLKKEKNLIRTFKMQIHSHFELSSLIVFHGFFFNIFLIFLVISEYLVFTLSLWFATTTEGNVAVKSP